MADFESIYRQNADTVFRFLLARTGSIDLSEELTQETFYQAIKSIHHYDGKSTISSWLCGIAKNLLYAHLRKKKREPVSADTVPGPVIASTEEIAETQEEIFEYASSNGYFMDDFIEKYMFSDFCNS